MPQIATSARLVLTAAALGLAVTACTSGGGSGSTPTASAQAGSSATAAPTATAGGGSASALPTAPGGGGAPSSAATPLAAACAGSQLGVSAGQSDGAAGHIGARVIFKNNSGSACTLYGFPGVAGLDASGKQQVQATRVTSGYLGTATASTVLLAPGATASSLVGGVDVPSGNATSCPSYPDLLVTPPGTKASSKVALSMPGCPTLVVYPVVAGVPQP